MDALLVPGDATQAMGVILPEAEGALGAFWRGVADGQLLLQHCRRCGHCWHPPLDVCSQCQSFDFDWRASVGLGTLYSYTVIHHAAHPVVAQWVPYTLCVVTLDEGPRMLSMIAAGSTGKPRIGERMELTFRAMPQGFRLPVFRRATTET